MNAFKVTVNAFNPRTLLTKALTLPPLTRSLFILLYQTNGEMHKQLNVLILYSESENNGNKLTMHPYTLYYLCQHIPASQSDMSPGRVTLL